MPDPALPFASQPDPVKRVTYRRFFSDALGRPLSGVVTFSAAGMVLSGDSVIMPIAVTVDLENGWLEVALPPGTYTMAAQLRGEYGEPLIDAFDVTIVAEE